MTKKIIFLILVFFVLVSTLNVGASLSDGLYSAYYMNGTGNMIDVSGNGFDFTESGTVDEQTGLGDTSEGKARGVFLSNEYFSRTSFGFHDVSDESWSMSFWTQKTAATVTEQLYNARESPSHYWTLQTGADGTIYFSVNGGSVNTDVGTWTIGSWYHFVFTYDGATRNFTGYYNGTYIDSLIKSDTSGVTAGECFGAPIWATTSETASETIIDEVVFWNRTLTHEEAIELDSTFLPYAMITTSENFTIRTYDAWNGSQIIHFSANINGTLYNSNSTGVIELNFLKNNTVQLDILINAADYFNVSHFNYFPNVTGDLNAQIYQSVVCFNASEKISGSVVNANTYTILTNSTTECFNISAGSYNVIASKTDWDSKNQTFSISALETKTVTVTDMYYNNLTIYAKNIITGAYIDSYELNLTSLNYTGWAGEYYPSTANKTFTLINGTYNVLIDATGYALTDSEVNMSLTGDGSYTFLLYPTNTVNITFYEETYNTILTEVNVTYEIILDDLNATIGWTNTSNTVISGLDAGEYEIRYRATENDYTERSYFFTLTNRTYNELKLYLINETTTDEITNTLYDQYGNRLEGYTIKILRYYPETNSYVIVDEGRTNTEGITVLTAILNNPYYQFRIFNSDGELVKTTSSSQLYETTITHYITLGSIIGEQLNNLNGLTSNINFLNTTNQFKFYWDNSDGTVTQTKVLVYKINARGNTLYNSSITYSSSGTSYVSVLEENGTTYRADAYVLFSGETNFIMVETLSYTFGNSFATFGVFGLFLTFIIIIVFGFIGMSVGVRVGVVAVPVALILTRVINFHGLDYTWLVSLLAVGVIISYVVGDK